MKVVFDTNVLISAILFGGNPRVLFKKVLSGEIYLFISEPIMQEFNDVISRPKFGLRISVINDIVNELILLCKTVVPIKRIRIIKDDPDDNKILECAVTAEADYIVSGDNHLLSLQKYKSIEILTPKQMVEELNKK